MKAVVVIPVYKAQPDTFEISSLVQCYKILGNHDIVIACSPELDITPYRQAVAPSEPVFEHFDPAYFKNIEGYNRLLTSAAFYERFKKNYAYLLICQLDAYVFKDELQHWIDQGLDYIGAPWLSGNDAQPEFTGVGNGGFSLRRTETCIRVLKTRFSKNFGAYLFRFYRHNVKEHLLLTSARTAYALTRKPFLTLERLLQDYPMNEDIFWSRIAPAVYASFKKGDYRQAAAFSFETHPEFLFAENKNTLPFGCHAFQKHMPFWKGHIR